MPDQPVRWERLTWEEVAAIRDGGCDLCVLPVGATEQHGPHLPLDVDTVTAEAIALGASARTGVPVLPALPYGCSLGHSGRWPGTISLRPETLSAILVQIAEWVRIGGFRRLVVLNAHVTNWAPLRCGLENIRHQWPDLRIGLRNVWDLSPAIHRRYHHDAANFHANEAETSLSLHLRPTTVRLERAEDEPDRSADCCFSYRVDQESRTGTVGTPSTASAARGAELHALLIDAFAAYLTRARAERAPLEP
jgi:creatinine amidohydrolase